jgi:hypothetical protein
LNGEIGSRVWSGREAKAGTKADGRKVMTSMRGWTMRLTVCGLATALAAQTADGPPDSTTLEYSVKAACIFNFLKFVAWPEGTAQSSAGTIRIGIVGEDPFGPVADRALEGKTVRGRRLTVERFKTFEAVAAARDRCQVLYVPAALEPQTAIGLRLLVGSAILSIGEAANFCQTGGIIRFRLEQERVGFEVNVTAAEREGLKISSTVLRLAAVVREPRGGVP